MNRNKKVLLSILTLAIMFVMNSLSFSEQSYTAEADFYDMDPALEHNEPYVDTVISSNMVLKPRTVAHLSRLCESLVAKLKFFFDGASSNVREGSDYTSTEGDVEFFPSTGRISNSYIGGTIDYKVSGDFKTLKSSGEIITLETPVEYKRAVIISSYTQLIDFNVGGTIVVATGDQSQAPYTQNVPKRSGLGMRNFTVHFGTLPENGGVSGVFRKFARSVSSSKREILLEGTCDGEVELYDGEEPPLIFTDDRTEGTFSSSQMDIVASAKRFVIEYNILPSDQQGSVTDKDWVDGTSSLNLIVDKETGKWSHYVVWNATYRIIAVMGSESTDYRPAKRVRVKSRIGTNGGFKFNNLVDGDVVKIYNVNGKKVAELTTGDAEGFEWRGREGTNNSGDWAKSGIYVYQIKLKDGKIISGTIVLAY